MVVLKFIPFGRTNPDKREGSWQDLSEGEGELVGGTHAGVKGVLLEKAQQTTDPTTEIAGPELQPLASKANSPQADPPVTKAPADTGQDSSQISSDDDAPPHLLEATPTPTIASIPSDQNPTTAPSCAAEEDSDGDTHSESSALSNPQRGPASSKSITSKPDNNAGWSTDPPT